MRILTIASGGRDSNGALLSAIHSTHGLAKRGHELFVLTPKDSFVDRHVNRSLAQVVNSTLDRWPLTEVNRIGRWCLDQQIDVIHTHSSRASAFGVMLRRLHTIPVVATAHATKIQLHWFLNDHVIAVSEATRRFHIRFNLVPPWKISTVLNPIDTEHFKRVDETARAGMRAELGLPPDTILMGIVGNIIPRKGHADAIKAMAITSRRFPTARLAIIGKGSQEEVSRLKQLAQQLGVADSLLWLGHREDVAPLIGSLDALLAPSLQEPFGLIAPEALACEVPVIASRLGGFLTTIQDCESGYLVKAHAPEELATAAGQLLRNPELRRRFGEVGRNWVKANLSPRVHFDAVERILANAVASGGRRRTPTSVRTA